MLPAVPVWWVCVGNADISAHRNRSGRHNPLGRPTRRSGRKPSGPSPTFGSATEAQHNHLIYGYAAGLGVDVNLIGGLFRGPNGNTPASLLLPIQPSTLSAPVSVTSSERAGTRDRAPSILLTELIPAVGLLVQ